MKRISKYLVIIDKTQLAYFIEKTWQASKWQKQKKKMLLTFEEVKTNNEVLTIAEN